MITSFVIQIFCEEHLVNVEVIGDEIKADCLACGKSKKHWGINLKTGRFRCWKCDWKGNFWTLHKYITGFFPNADKLEEEYSSELSLETLSEIFKPVNETSNNQKYPADWTEGTCEIDTIGRVPKRAREYLLTRNISVELAKELDFRVAVSGKYSGRIIMPIVEGGMVQNFVARLIGEEGKRYTGPHRNESYINKSKLLWNLDNIRYNSEIVLVEGIFDCIAIMEEYPTVVMFGKTLSDVQAEKLLVKAKSVVVLLDAEFLLSAKKITEKLLGIIPITIAQMSKGDPSSHTKLAIKAIENAVDYYLL